MFVIGVSLLLPAGQKPVLNFYLSSCHVYDSNFNKILSNFKTRKSVFQKTSLIKSKHFHHPFISRFDMYVNKWVYVRVNIWNDKVQETRNRQRIMVERWEQSKSRLGKGGDLCLSIAELTGRSSYFFGFLSYL